MIRLNYKEIEVTMFPDKTSQVWKIDENLFKYNGENVIVWDFESEGELMHVAQLIDLIRVKAMFSKIVLVIPYFPYARQDKSITNESTFALKTFIKIIDSFKVHRIEVDDIHSNYALSNLDTNIINHEPTQDICYTAGRVEADYLAYPDAGAAIRYGSRIGRISVTLKKERDQSTGALKMHGIEQSPELVKDAKLLIVDDICDGGGTFILAANELYRLGAKEVHLYTTHGLYTKGLTQLKEAGIMRIFNRRGEVK